MRTGLGYDIHRLVEGRKLILGGVAIPYDKGLLGHSDGDALLHAIMDAILGALALGDIGGHFPDDSPKYKNADSMVLMKRVFSSVSERGYRVVNVDANILAEKPKMSSHINSMREKIAAALEVGTADVSVKARTSEGLGEIGSGLAIAAQAVVTLEKK